MSVRTWFAGAGRRRAALEAGLVTFALVLPLAAILRPALGLDLGPDSAPDADNRWPVLGIGMFYFGLPPALLAALRLRRSAGGVRKQLRYELGGAATLVFAVWAGALVAHVAGAAWATATDPPAPAAEPEFLFASPLLAAASASAVVSSYPLGRGLVLAWPAWDRLQRRRLLWALTHAQLVGSLALAAGVALFLTAYLGPHFIGPPFGPDTLPKGAGAAAVALAWLATRPLPAATGYIVVGVATSAVLLPPAFLISYLVLRRTTRRLEELAAATGALRAGDLAARVPVGGEDEVGRLQADFNSMAAELERTLGDLEAERDRVAGLLEARRQLVAAVSHELRTPVATVRGYLESALRRGEAAPALRADLETMEREVARLERLIEDLFTLSRAEVRRLTLRQGPTDVGAVVGRLVDTLAPLAWQQRRVQVFAGATPDLPLARADGERLEQVVRNLLGNAVRHTPPGGLVAAAVAAEPDAVRVDVRDTGEGIAAADLPHIFERFYRANGDDPERGDGAGLGLALVRELVEAMGGSVAAASTPGEGSCFTVRLPRA
jgi:signal transduction histidine kinase